LDALIKSLQRRGASLRQILVDAGYAVNVLIYALLRVLPDGKHRLGSIMEQLKCCGLSPLPVVAVVGLFTGMILTLQVGVELERFGQAERISDIIGVIMFREMGPFMTAMILTASVGSAMAAEIGTMAVSEELDALECLSVDPISILVMPRVEAMTIMTPLVTFVGNVIGCVGGGVVAATQLDVSVDVYIRNVISSLQASGESFGPLPEEIYTGLVKSVIFGLLVSSISCAAGLKARGGAIGVGRAVRTAVIRSFLMIIIIGYYISWLFFR
jgi:phospholipid/cholesterol/gamma-HCH transport system permease protein